MYIRMLSLVMVMLLLSTPVLAMEQNLAQVQLEAMADAKKDLSAVNSEFWFAAGCGCGLLGVLLAYAYTEDVPADRMIGKSPEYVLYYTTEYQRLTRNERLLSSAYGSVMGTAVSILVLVVLADLNRL